MAHYNQEESVQDQQIFYRLGIVLKDWFQAIINRNIKKKNEIMRLNALDKELEIKKCTGLLKSTGQDGTFLALLNTLRGKCKCGQILTPEHAEIELKEKIYWKAILKEVIVLENSCEKKKKFRVYILNKIKNLKKPEGYNSNNNNTVY